MDKFVEYPELVRKEFPEYSTFKDICMRIDGLKGLGYEVKSFAWAQAITRTHGIDITKKD
jgi:hypothetical protein